MSGRPWLAREQQNARKRSGRRKKPLHQSCGISICRGTRRTERLPWVRAYWQRQEPDYCDGAGAESFHALVARARLVLQRIEERPEETIVLFSHGQFISCLLDVARHPYATDGERMAIFRSLPELENTGLVYLLLPQHE